MDAFLCESIRTPIGRYGGTLSAIRTDDLAALPLSHLRESLVDADWDALDDIYMGCTNQAGEDNRNVARMASLLAGFSDKVPAVTLNRLCASGMDAVAAAARAIQSGDSAFCIAGGVESMSRAPFVMPKAESAFSRNNTVYDTTIGWRFINPKLDARIGHESMPETADNVAQVYEISRQDQDKFALRSQQKWQDAQDRGWYAREILPVSIPQRKGEPVTMAQDEHPRPATTLEALAKLREINANGHGVTAGNSSGVNDGAAAMVIASEAAAKANGLTPIARIVTFQSVGVSPSLMGIGPIEAVQKALAKANLTLNDMAIIELNEAFASQSLACLRGLGIADDDPRVNPNGGAIALGHPLGMTGARIAMAAARELHASSGQYALASMCVGVGQGTAMILERV